MEFRRGSAFMLRNSAPELTGRCEMNHSRISLKLTGQRAVRRVVYSVACASLLSSTSLAQNITSNLVAHWNYDDAAGSTALDSTTNNYDGTLTGNPVWQTDAKLNGGLDFETGDGADRVDAGSFDLTGSGVTLAAWIRPESGSTDQRIVIKSSGNAAADQYWALICDAANIADFRIKAGGVWNRVEVPNAVSAGHWYHMVGTYDGSVMRLYVDGVEVGNRVHPIGGPVDTSASASVTLGDSPVGGRAFDGVMDDVRIYDRALTAADVTALFEYGWGAKNVLLVTQNNGSLNAQERSRKKHFEDWDYRVSTVWSGDSQAAFDAALVGQQVAYVSDQASATSISYKLREATAGVVSESQCLVDELGFSSAACWSSTSTTDITIVDNTHSITLGLAAGPLTVFNSTETGVYLSGSPAPSLTALGNLNSGASLSLIEGGGTLANTYNGSNAAFGRRVQLPFGTGSFDFTSLNADGRLIVERALEWAAGGGLIGHWKLDEAAGPTAADSSTFARDGTYENGPVLNQPGIYGTAALFDGTNDRVVIADHPSFSGHAGDGLSVSAWVRVIGVNTDGHGQSRQPIVAKGNSGQWEWALYVYDNGAAGFSSWQQTGSSHSEISGGSIPLGAWVHVAATYEDGIANRVYVNGVQVAVGSSFSGSAYDGDRPVLIGAREDGQYLNAEIDDVRIYSYALTASEVGTLFSGVDFPVAHWKLDETSGTTATDSGPSGLDGTYQNGVVLNSAGPYPGAGAVAAQFDGANDRVSLPSANFSFSGGITISAWIKPTGPGAPYKAIASWSNGISVDDIWFGWQPGYGLEIWLTDTVAGGTRWAADYIEPQIGVWEHCVCTIDAAGNAKLYRNGVQTGSGFTSLPRSVLRTQNYIGSSVYNDEFPGCIDDVRLYTRALTASEVAELYGLIGHWKFDEGVGVTAADSTGFANDATLTGGATWTTDCKGRSALEVDGAGGIAQTGSNFAPPAQGTVAYWMRASGPPATRSRIWGVEGNFETRQEPDGTLSFDILAEGPPEFVTSNDLSTDGRWRHIVAIFDSADDSYTVYVDGKLDKTGVNGDNMAPRNPNILSFGTRTGNSQYWEGGLRDFRIYNRPLSAREISELSGLVGHWKFDETSGTVAADSTGNGNDGVYVNGPTLGVTSENPPVLGTAVEFDGNNDYVEIPHSNLMLADAGSISFWAKANSQSGQQGLFSKDSSGFDTGGHLSVFFVNNTVEVRLQSTSNSYTLVSGGLATNKWCHVAFTWGSEGMVLYIDGIPIDSNPSYTGGLGTSSGGIGNYEPIAVGANSWGSGNLVVTPLQHYYDGAIDDLHFFARQLCPEEVFNGYIDGRRSGLRIKTWVETR